MHECVCVCVCVYIKPTLLFRRSLSFRVSVSALAMTGTMLTLLWIAFINSTSRGLRLEWTNGMHTHTKKNKKNRRNVLIIRNWVRLPYATSNYTTAQSEKVELKENNTIKDDVIRK